MGYKYTTVSDGFPLDINPGLTWLDPNIKPEGQGGFQGLIEKLQNSWNEVTGEIYVSQDDVARIKDYHNKYQDGGFQGSLRQTFGAYIDFDQ